MHTTELSYASESLAKWENWESSETWKTLRHKVQNDLKQNGKDSLEKEPDFAVALITDELIVNALRFTERPEGIYWLLRQYMDSHDRLPVITTSKGKSIYIEFDHIDEVIYLYIGAAEDVICIGQENGKKIYAMDVQEKFDFLLYSSLGVVLKRHNTAAHLIEQSAHLAGNRETIIPTLFFTSGNEDEASVCVLGTNKWYEKTGNLNETASKKFGSQSNNVRSVFSIRPNGKNEHLSRSAG